MSLPRRLIPERAQGRDPSPQRHGAGNTRRAIIVVTHDEKIIPTFKRIYHIRDGATHEEAGEGRAID